MRKQFTVDDFSHYIFTPRDLTSWVLGLLRYPTAQDTGSSPNLLLEVWAYEARRVFRDRLVGEKAVAEFDAILGSVLRSNWSFDAAALDADGGIFFVTWGSSQSSKVGGPFGKPLGRLSANDLHEVVAKAVVAYG